MDEWTLYFINAFGKQFEKDRQATVYFDTIQQAQSFKAKFENSDQTEKSDMKKRWVATITNCFCPGVILCIFNLYVKAGDIETFAKWARDLNGAAELVLEARERPS